MLTINWNIIYISFQYFKCLKSADDDITEARKSSEQFQRAEVLGRVNIERMLKQVIG